MKKGGKYIVGCVIIMLITVFIGMFIGSSSYFAADAVGFYAEIEEIRENSLLVNGLSENDINHRGEFVVSLEDIRRKKDVIDYQGKAVGVGELAVGRIIYISYDGVVQDSYPAGISKVYKIQIMD